MADMNTDQAKCDPAADLLREWQQRLGLSDWHVKLVPYCRPSDIEGDNAGEAEWVTVNRWAVIRILAEKYHETPEYYDFERTLVHELLHLKFAMLFDSLDGLAEVVLHQTIEDLARAYIATKRKDAVYG